MKTLIGIDIGGTKCAVSLGQMQHEEIKILGKEIFMTRDYDGPEKMILKLQKGVEEILVRHHLSKIDLHAIGISCGGPLDSKKGVILSPPNLPGWDAVPISKLFQDKYGVPVLLQNDANACAVAEWKFGAGRGLQNMIFLTFGTGLGAGLILDGKLYSGTNDMAGEVGHIRLDNMGPVGYGKAGSFEGFCSGSGIAQLAQIKVREKFQMGETVSFCRNNEELTALTSQTVAEAAFAGDELACEVFKICGTYFGQGLSILIDVLNPERIVIGSIFLRAGELLLPSMMETLKRETLSLSRNICQIVPAALGESIGDYAALSVAAMNIKA